MSTPDGRLPGELSLASHAPTDVQNGATPPLVSPGAGLAAARTPTAPTHPDPDPVTMTLLLQRMGNDLLGVPAPAPSPVGAAPVAVPSASPPSAPSSLPSTAAPAPHPFLSPLSFDGLIPADGSPLQFNGESFQVPLVDRDNEPAAAGHAPAAARPGAAPAEPLPFEVRPVVDVGVPRGNGGFDARALKQEFPILQERVNGKQLVWLDNAATTQKPRAVIDRITHFYEHENSNIHRAAHALAARATDAYESARESVRRFVNAGSARDVIFVRGTTEGINLVAQSWGRRNINAGDEIVITHLEHHANIVPWQMLCAEKGARLRVAPVNDRGEIILDEYEKLFTPKTRLASIPQVSNALGTITPAREMIAIAHRHGALALLDAAQSVSHMRVDVQQLGCDFLVFSGHKVFAPTGIGAVVARAELMDQVPPWQGGGNMIADVTFEKTVYQASPARFEAGTGNIADAVGMGAALEWLTRVGIESVERHEHDLLVYGTEKLLTVPGLRIIGNAVHKAGVLSFVIAGHETHAISTALDKEGIAVRGGHHCAQPILRRMGLESTVRASLAPYNTFEDLDALTAALCRIVGA